MGWETRRNGRYYYQKERRGGRVVSTYLGGGATAQLIAEIEASRREIAQWRARDERLEREEFRKLASTPPELVALLQEARRATAEVLRAAGYHQHKRQWRKKRGSKDKDTQAG